MLKRLLILSLSFLLFSLNSFGTDNPIILHKDSFDENLVKHVSIFTSKEKISAQAIDLNNFSSYDSDDSFFYFDFYLNTICLKLNIVNELDIENQALIRFSNSLINEINGYRLANDKLINDFNSGIKFPFSSRKIDNRNFLIPINLKPKEKLTYLIYINKAEGRPLVTNINLLSTRDFSYKNSKEYIIIGLYAGLSVIFIIAGLFLFLHTKKVTYLYYIFYILFLELFLISYMGIFQQFLINKDFLFNKYFNYVIFSEMAIILFAVFSQRILNVKRYRPKLYKIVIWTLVVVVSMRLFLHIFKESLFNQFIPVFMKIWYVLMLVVMIAIGFQIIVLYRKNARINSLFAVAYLLMVIGSIISVFYHSYGLINGIIYNLPILLFTSFLEIIFISIAIGVLVYKTLDENKVELAKLQEKSLRKYIAFKNNERVYLDTLKYIKSDGNYLEFYYDEGKTVDRNQLKTVQENLPSNFAKVHRSYIVNKNFIKTVKSTSLLLQPNIEIPLSRIFKKNLDS